MNEAAAHNSKKIDLKSNLAITLEVKSSESN